MENPVELDYSKISNVEIEGLDMRDYPDFCDAYIASADYDGKPMTEEQLEVIQQDSSFTHEHAFEAWH